MSRHKSQDQRAADGLRHVAASMRYVASDLTGTDLGRGLERQAIRLCLRAQELDAPAQRPRLHLIAQRRRELATDSVETMEAAP